MSSPRRHYSRRPKPRDFAYLHLHNSAYWTRIWPNRKKVNPNSERRGRTSRNCHRSVLPLAISAEESFHEEARERGARDAWSLLSGPPTSGENPKSMGSLTVVRHSLSTPFHDENVKNQAQNSRGYKRESEEEICAGQETSYYSTAVPEQTAALNRRHERSKRINDSIDSWSRSLFPSCCLCAPAINDGSAEYRSR
jgi:hypothetical protein